MRILSITAQKPDSTGSGIYLTELVRAMEEMGHQQAVIAGIYREDRPVFPEGTAFFPVYFESEELPFPIAGMSDEMPYRSTRYRDMTEDMADRFMHAFEQKALEAVPGVQSAQVSHEAGRAVVQCAEAVSDEALRKAVRYAEDNNLAGVVVCGSLYLAAEARPWLLKEAEK